MSARIPGATVCLWYERDAESAARQIIPKALTEALARGGDTAKRAFTAMMAMKKIDVAVIESVVRADA